jgi:hypothetical protein|tara:strand:- start:906 stop:1202 length:297 start_codon:yes stop_codon:yes gene_type:complete
MARSYKWTIPLKALEALTLETSGGPEGGTGSGWFNSGSISERAESMCRWEVSQRAVAVAMRKWMAKGIVEGRKVRQQTFSQARVEVWEWRLLEKRDGA